MAADDALFASIMKASAQEDPLTALLQCAVDAGRAEAAAVVYPVGDAYHVEACADVKPRLSAGVLLPPDALGIAISEPADRAWKSTSLESAKLPFRYAARASILSDETPLRWLAFLRATPFDDQDRTWMTAVCLAIETALTHQLLARTQGHLLQENGIGPPRADAVTGLMGPSALYALMLQIQPGPAHSPSPTLILFHATELKEANRVRGREGGDALLRAVAGELRLSVRPTDYVARLDGPFFGLLIPGRSLATATTVATRVVEKVSQELDAEVRAWVQPLGEQQFSDEAALDAFVVDLGNQLKQSTRAVESPLHLRLV